MWCSQAASSQEVTVKVRGGQGFPRCSVGLSQFRRCSRSKQPVKYPHGLISTFSNQFSQSVPPVNVLSVSRQKGLKVCHQLPFETPTSYSSACSLGCLSTKNLKERGKRLSVRKQRLAKVSVHSLTKKEKKTKTKSNFLTERVRLFSPQEGITHHAARTLTWDAYDQPVAEAIFINEVHTSHQEHTSTSFLFHLSYIRHQPHFLKDV